MDKKGPVCAGKWATTGTNQSNDDDDDESKNAVSIASQRASPNVSTYIKRLLGSIQEETY